MTVNEPPRPQNAVLPPQRPFLVRAALLAGGATTGLAASALAGFGLVGLMFPNSGLPGTGNAPLTAAAYMPAPVTVSVMPEMELARYQPAPVPVPAPAIPARPAPVHRPATAAPEPEPAGPATHKPHRLTDPAAAVDSAPTLAPEVIATAPDPVAALDPETGLETGLVTGLVTRPATGPGTRPVVAGKTGPAAATVDPAPGIDRSGFGPRLAAIAPAEVESREAAPDTAGFGPRIAARPAHSDAPATATPATLPPEDFAMLAEDDAAARAGAGLFTEPAAPADTATAALTDPADPAADMPRTRPARRPEGLTELAAAMVVPPEPSAAPVRSIRPAPRPEIQLAAATLPAPEAAAAVAELPAPTAVVDVKAPQSPRGFFSGGSSNCGRSLARAMPSRRGGATGSAFFAGLADAWGPERDADVIAELARGNMPRFLRNLQPVTFKGQDARGAQAEITICVTPDYLALGSDKDFVRVPLGLPAAARIAGAFNMTLPTPRMVDAIYSQAAVRLVPEPMKASPQMQSTAYLLRHNATVAAQLGGRGGLVAGHKKDVVMASRMASAPGRVAIYGWHRSNGTPIQPVSTVHGADYADYSHGIRLVSKTAYLNGKAVSLDDLLESGRYAYLLNNDGPMPGPVIRTASR